MEQFKLEAGSVIHINGLPFYLVQDTLFEGHPANISAATMEDPDSGGRFVLNIEALRPPTLERRILNWWRSW